jgi:hypothetical protein
MSIRSLGEPRYPTDGLVGLHLMSQESADGQVNMDISLITSYILSLGNWAHSHAFRWESILVPCYLADAEPANVGRARPSAAAPHRIDFATEPPEV